MSALDVIARARETGDYSLLSDLSPYSRFLGISAITQGDELLGKLTYSPMLIGNVMIPALHGGTIGALLESTAIFQIFRETGTQTLPKIINITVEFLRTGKAVDTFARGVITKHGRRVANVRAEAWQDDRARPIAAAHAHFLLDR